MGKKAPKETVPPSVTYHDLKGSLKLVFAPKNDEQKELLKTISTNLITLVRGAPGTGKSFVAVAYALRELIYGRYERLIITRPVIEAAGERLGFLPGDMNEKIDPYMMPIYDILQRLIPTDVMNRMLSKNGKEAAIKIIPLAFMRGLTFQNCIVIADEIQNSSVEQVRLLLTRFGENSKMILCGDVNQSDIAKMNGLEDAYNLLQGVEGIGFVTLTEDAIVRHPIVAMIEGKYRSRAEKKDDKNTIKR